MNIFYRLGNKLYINLTNSCSNRCVFCIREKVKGVGSADTLWLPRVPEIVEIKRAFDEIALDNITEIVFCGFGDPLDAADTVAEICYYMKERTPLPVRINTAGVVRLVCPGFDISRLACADSISVSLNAASAAEYARLTRSRFGEDAYGAMLDFARDAKEFAAATFSVLDVIGADEIAKCQRIADEMGIPLRVRPME